MPKRQAKRPAVQCRFYTWKDKGGIETPGIALWAKAGLVVHMTDVEARTLADRLHDLADRLQGLESSLHGLAAELPITHCSK